MTSPLKGPLAVPVFLLLGQEINPSSCTPAQPYIKEALAAISAESLGEGSAKIAQLVKTLPARAFLLHQTPPPNSIHLNT